MAQELDRRLARDPARRPYLAAARGQDLVAVAPPPWRDGLPFGDAVADLGDARWWAVVAGPVPLEAVATAYAEAVDGLRVAPAISAAGTLLAVEDIALERALVADPVLATAGVARWLGPLIEAPRGGRELVRTLSAWLDAGHSVTATARALDVAPRTVSYRLARIAALLGVPALDADVVARLSAAVLMAGLLPPERVASTT
jgi:DNA-binding PucR family transcriptional regulator